MVNEGDFILLEYSGRTRDGVVFDTTNADEAKSAGIYNPKAKYGPVLVVAGKRQVLPGLDEAVLAAEIGVQKTAEIPPEKAFGERNANLVSLVPSSKFSDANIPNPKPGMVLDFDGNPGKIVGVEAGRVRVDFNHPLAGQTLAYSFKVGIVFSKAADKLAAIVSDAFPVGVTAELKGEQAVFAVNAQAPKGADFIVAKMRAIQLLLQYVDEVKKVVFVEEYVEPQDLSDKPSDRKDLDTEDELDALKDLKI